MSKETNKLIPDLRFPEFVNDSQWENIELGEISEIVRGGSPRPIQDYTTTNSDGLNWLKIADVPSDSKYITNTKEKVIRDALNSTREVNPGDLILSNSMSFGRPYILKIKTCIHDGWIAIRKISNKTFEDYLYYFISSESCQSYFQTNAAGAAVKNLNAEIIKLLPIYLPKDKNEQQKIAACLSSLVEVITAHSQKLDLLKEHKKGLMHNLFPQDGEKVPRLRFKEFVNDEEWKEKPLGSLSNLISEKAGTKKYKLLSVTAGIGFVSQLEKFGREIAGDSYKNYYVIRKGDFAYNKSSVKIHPEGQIALLENDDFGAVPNSIFTCFRVDKNILLPAFLKYPFENNIHGKWLRKFIAVGARANGALNVDNKDLLALPIKFPSIAEQQKIASCLSSLDDLIKSQTEKVEQLKLHKKGLMQGLFPKINE